MKKHSIVVLILWATFSFTSCHKESLSPISYVQWIEAPENGLRKVKNIGPIRFALQYKPIEYVIAREQRSEILEEKLFLKRKKDLDGMQYFNLTYDLPGSNQDVVRYGSGGAEDYQDRIYYLSYGLQKDIKLVEGKDTLECKLFQFARHYGLSSKASFVLGFDIQNPAADKKLIIDERLFNSGKVQFLLTASDIKNTPHIITLK